MSLDGDRPRAVYRCPECSGFYQYKLYAVEVFEWDAAFETFVPKKAVLCRECLPGDLRWRQDYDAKGAA